MENERDARIREIDKRIEDLSLHRSMWDHAGGMGGNMAMNADIEIKELMEEKKDLMNDIDNVGIARKHARLRELKKLREQAHFLKKIKYNSEIKEVEDQIQEFRNNSIRK